MSMEHWPSLTGLTATSIPKQLLVLGQNMTPRSDKHRTFLCKLSQFSKPESLQPQQQSWFYKDYITTLMLSQALVDSGTASALSKPINSNYRSNTFHSWQALLWQPFWPAVMLCRTAPAAKFLTGFEEGLKHSSCYKSPFALYFLMRQNPFASRIQEKVRWLSAVAVKNHGLLLNKHLLYRYKRATISLGAANARTWVSFATAKTSGSLKFCVAWLRSKANRSYDMSREIILYNGKSLTYSCNK